MPPPRRGSQSGLRLPTSLSTTAIVMQCKNGARKQLVIFQTWGSEAVRGRCENIPWGQSGHSSAVDSHTTPRQTVISPPALLHFRSLPFPVARSLHSPLLVAWWGRQLLPVWNICMQSSASSVCMSIYLHIYAHSMIGIFSGDGSSCTFTPSC